MGCKLSHEHRSSVIPTNSKHYLPDVEGDAAVAAQLSSKHSSRGRDEVAATIPPIAASSPRVNAAEIVKKLGITEDEGDIDATIVQPDASLKDSISLEPTQSVELVQEQTSPLIVEKPIVQVQQLDHTRKRPPTPKKIHLRGNFEGRKISFRDRMKKTPEGLPQPQPPPPTTPPISAEMTKSIQKKDNKDSDIEKSFDDIEVVQTSSSESDNESSDAEADTEDWLATSSGANKISTSESSDSDGNEITDFLDDTSVPKAAPSPKKIQSKVLCKPPLENDTKHIDNKPHTPTPVVFTPEPTVASSIRDTTVVKKKKAQLPTHNLPHPKPISGDWLNSRIMINNYIILESLGTGSYAEVKLCKEKTSGNLYAMKFIDRDIMHKQGKLNRQPESIMDIKREIAIMKKLNHPNVLRLFEVMDDPHMNKLFLVLEYMQLGDLLSFQKAQMQGAAVSTPNAICEPMLDPELHGVVLQVLHGLAYLHDQNIVHGDLKPQNLLIGEKGIVKIADFGISQNLYGSKQQLLESKGTPAFMSPEMCSGIQYSGQLADVWAVGATLYMLKFGNPPFVAKTTLQVFEKIQNDTLVFPIPIDPILEDFLIKIMTKDPTQRLSLHDALAHPWITKNRLLDRRRYMTVRITVSADEINSAIHETMSPTTPKPAELIVKAATPTVKPPPPDAAPPLTDRLQQLHRNGSSKRHAVMQKRNQNLSNEETSYRSTIFAQKKSHSRLVKSDDVDNVDSECSDEGDIDGENLDEATTPFMHHLDELLMTTLAPSAQKVLPEAKMKDGICELSTSTSLNRVLGIRAASFSVQGRRSTQEDRCRVITNVFEFDEKLPTEYNRVAFLGLYDGHGGTEAALFLKETLHKRLLDAIPIPFPEAAHLTTIVQTTCLAFDIELCDLLYTTDSSSGSTGTFCLLDGTLSHQRLVLGHVGDCRAVLCRKGYACVLTKDHRCTNPEEEGVVEARNIINNRINGVLAITRTFGDLEFKGRQLKASERAARIYSQESVGAVLTARPDVIVLEIQPTDEFILFGCDGLWEAMSCEDAVEFVQTKLQVHGQLQLAAEELAEEAVRRLSSDNVSVIIVQLNHRNG
ncbi:kinase [Thraustotheca clavata]|uniref:Kinase n=1 Tax=Thraustotheca clavata TaxID=74557 RepID=A0A1V9ZJ07_9STRA|nr:kinase [Thraustotheca clavata]